MRTPDDLKHHLWKHLKSDRTVMIGLETAHDDYPRPMTVISDEETGKEHGPLWIFTATDTSLVQELRGGSQKAVATFASKNHDLFATIRGTLTRDDDRAAIDRLWNSHVAAWYEGGKDDPKLALLRFDLVNAEIWENASSALAGIKALFGSDPKEDYSDKKARVGLS